MYKGCDLVFVPAAYPKSIGPQYWDLTHRARAVDNQMFVAAIAPARNDDATYVVYGHSMIIDPVGKILAQAGAREEIIFYEIGKIKLRNDRKKGKKKLKMSRGLFIMCI